MHRPTLSRQSRPVALRQDIPLRVHNDAVAVECVKRKWSTELVRYRGYKEQQVKTTCVWPILNLSRTVGAPTASRVTTRFDHQ